MQIATTIQIMRLRSPNITQELAESVLITALTVACSKYRSIGKTIGKNTKIFKTRSVTLKIGQFERANCALTLRGNFVVLMHESGGISRSSVKRSGEPF